MAWHDFIPDPWAFFLLAAAGYRIFRLIAEDEILERPRRWFLRLGSDWEKDGDPVPENYRAKWALFLTCPHCCGFWVGLAWWGAWLIWPYWTLVATVPFALNVIVGALAHFLITDEE